MVQEKNTKLNYPQNMLAHGFKTMCKAFETTHGFIVHGLGGFAHGYGF